MTKADLIAKVAENSGVSKKDTEAVISGLTKTITEELANKGEVAFVGFGTFKTSQRAAREGKNPATGEKLQIAARTAPVFKPGKALKDAVK